jgi:hypothetical protein
MAMYLILRCPDCADRTIEEQKQLGSYCKTCWDAIRTQEPECVLCKVHIKVTRLHVCRRAGFGTTLLCGPCCDTIRHHLMQLW